MAIKKASTAKIKIVSAQENSKLRASLLSEDKLELLTIFDELAEGKGVQFPVKGGRDDLKKSLATVRNLLERHGHKAAVFLPEDLTMNVLLINKISAEEAAKRKRKK